MGTFKSRGLRGSTFEEFINRSNEVYEESHLALIQKIPTPITPIEMDQSHRQITLAYFDKKSTVDYIGAVQGIPVCFDAKECHESTFPMQNIHEHQFQFMTEFERQNGIAFILIYFTTIDKYYYLTFDKLRFFHDRAVNGGRKSFRIDELEEQFFFTSGAGLLVPYLDMLQLDLNQRDA